MTIKRVYVDRAVLLREALDIDIPDSLTAPDHINAHVLTAMESGAFNRRWEEELCPLERIGVEIFVRRD
jgi:hypothetical protein